VRASTLVVACLLAALAGMLAPPVARGADEPRGGVSMPPALRARLDRVATVRGSARPALPEFPTSRRRVTDLVDVSSTIAGSDPLALAVVAHQAREALAWWLGDDAALRMRIPERPVVFCTAEERLAWLETLDHSPQDLARERRYGANYGRGLHVSEHPTRGLNGPWPRAAMEDALSIFAQDLLLAACPRAPAFLREGMRYLVCALLSRRTGIAMVRESRYVQGGATYVAMPERWVRDAEGERQVFNPGFLTAMIRQERDEDLRVVFGKQYDTLTSDADVKAYFFVRWLVEVVDPERARFARWFESIVDGVPGPDAASRSLLADAPPTGVLEALDNQFRKEHLRAFPHAGPLVPDWTGIWTPTPASLNEANREARRERRPVLRRVQMELEADGRWTERREFEAGEPRVRHGTWAGWTAQVDLYATGNDGSRSWFGTEEALRGDDLEWRRKRKPT
jgi:hypothetical protein